MQKKSLTGKVALVTGAARRIGAEIAKKLHEAGMQMVLHYNTSAEEAVQLCEQLNQLRPQSASVLRASLNEPESAQSLIKQAAAISGRLDVLVNNASRFYRTQLGAVTDYAWDDLLNSNLKAPFFFSASSGAIFKTNAWGDY